MKKFVSSLLANTRDRRKRGFTLIELLIVIGILGILVVAVLLTINPAEAQKKSRDAKRFKDAQTLQAALQQFFDGGGANPCVTAGGCSYTSATGANATNPNNTGNWMGGMLVGAYVTVLPTDPLDGNATTNVCTTNATTTSPISGRAVATMGYRVTVPVNTANPGTTYEIDVRQEAISNCPKVVNDGGNSAEWLETGTDLTLATN